jgi:hypothetical protein
MSGLRRRAASAVSAAAIGIVLVGLLLGIDGSGAILLDTTGNDANSVAADGSFDRTFRVTTYEVRSGAFTGTSYDLVLQQNLQAEYFVVLRGGAGNNNSSTHRNPDQDYARVAGDPHGNFAAVTAGNVVRLVRGAAGSNWQGQVTVVESLADHSTSGFQLLDVVELTVGSGVTTASGNSAASWSDIADVGLYGGIRGGGVATTASNRNDHLTAWGRLYPTGSATVNLERRIGGGAGSLSGTTDFTVYVVEWGSQWSIQRVVVSGTQGGQGADQTGEYTTGAISPVPRAGTFVLGYGWTTGRGIGNGWEGQLFTLGDGVNQNAVEAAVAVGSEYAELHTAEVYVHTHPDLAVDYRFGTDGGNPGIPSGALSATVTVDSALAPESYVGTGQVWRTSGSRFTVIANTSNGTGTAFPRPMTWSRPTADAQATWTRSRSGQPGAFWLQSVDFGEIWS